MGKSTHIQWNPCPNFAFSSSLAPDAPALPILDTPIPKNPSGVNTYTKNTPKQGNTCPNFLLKSSQPYKKTFPIKP